MKKLLKRLWSLDIDFMSTAAVQNLNAAARDFSLCMLRKKTNFTNLKSVKIWWKSFACEGQKVRKLVNIWHPHQSFFHCSTEIKMNFFSRPFSSTEIHKPERKRVFLFYYMIFFRSFTDATFSLGIAWVWHSTNF